MKEDEKFVRERWGGNRGSDPWLYEGKRKLELTLYGHPTIKFFGAAKDGADWLWKQAAEFTRQRLEEIRQVEEEIEFLSRVGIGGCCNAELQIKSAIVGRILAREQAALSDLRKGMKP